MLVLITTLYTSQWNKIYLQFYMYLARQLKKIQTHLLYKFGFMEPE